MKATIIEETTRRVTNEYGDLIIIFPPGPTPAPPKPCPDGQVRNEKGVCVIPPKDGCQKVK